ncbi:DUF4177 domain-containing protein [Roseivivax isoporae]|uniref:DUF4177 domain-containing protein n=1 Tax=Roseivivax isoporae LMG 25204 TaxID=1449351 RepID=X7F8U6_9RHOB|nr:DUF4177 domain-containing protein [Roseivivax isoporae]ETX29235.1 hypothetical protein RISW2_02165 [Roseivivax isoporae LMG 25204]
MPDYEYRIVPAPYRGEKAKGLKTPEARFARAVERVMNEMAAEGWEYQRSDTLPAEERSGLASTVTTWRTLLVFRRPRSGSPEGLQPRLLEKPEEGTPPEAPAPATAAAPEADKAGEVRIVPGPPPQKPSVLTDNGVENTQQVRDLSAILRARADRTPDR